MPQTEKKVICLGFFDGVHIGHRAILQKGAEFAAELGAKAYALTFDRHPLSVITGRETPLIDSFERRVELLGRVEGIAGVRVLNFTQALARMEWQDFLDNIIFRENDIAGIAAGFDYSFGRGGLGNARNISEVCAQRGIGCAIVLAVTRDGKKVSSSLIRELISEGNAEGAAPLLGRPFGLAGTIEEGRHIARTLGFPTLNMRMEKGIISPKFGVYISKCSIDGGDFLPAVTNIGLRPTITDGRAAVETHILGGIDQSGYGRPCEIEILTRLRDERLFEGPEALRAQVGEDIARAKAWFANRKENTDG